MAKLKRRKVATKREKAKVLKPRKRRKILVKKRKIKKQVKRIFKKRKTVLKKRKKIVRVKKAVRKAIKPKTKKRVSKKIVKPRVKKKLMAKKARPRKIQKINKIIRQKIRKSSLKVETEKFSAEALFKAKIKVIGIGGGGGSIVSEIGRSLEKATFVIADTDIRALKKKSGIKYFWFGEELTHGLGTGVNVELAKQAAESAKEKISSFFKDQDIIIFVASLGGGLGSGATQVFADAAKEFGGITFGIFTMPFKFEGKNKYRIAQNALKSLRKSLNVSLVIPNEKIFKVIDETTPITNAFSTVNKSLIESLESLIDLIYNPGIINIDFADLRTILKGRGNTAFLNTIEESGKNRIEKICEKVFKNPLLQNSGFEAEKILFNISGAENLSMFEVEKISSHIANLNPKAKIIFGISKNSKLKNKIKTTILMTGGEIEEKATKEAPVKKIESVKELAQKEIKQPPKKEKKKQNFAKNKKPKPRNKKPASALKEPRSSGEAKEGKPISFIPVFEVPNPSIPVLDQKVDIKQGTASALEAVSFGVSTKKTIRRSGLEIKKAEELQEKKRIAQEKEWEIPAFLRKVKFKS